MSRRRWYCRNPHCIVEHGAVLGFLKGDGGLVLEPGVMLAAVYLDIRKVIVTCPVCGLEREFQGAWVRSHRRLPR